MIIDRLKEILDDILEVSVDEINEETDFIADLEADSLDLVQMVIAVEKEYNLTFEEDDIDKVKTVGDVIKYIEANGK